LSSNYLFRITISRLIILLLAIFPTLATAQSIIVEQPKGVVIKLVNRGDTDCGVLEWEHARQAGNFTILNTTREQDENKLPLTKAQWQTLLTRVAGDQAEVTIAHAWRDDAPGLAAAIRIAQDIRSHGGTAWAYNGRFNKNMLHKTCTGNYTFKGTPIKIFLNEPEFWELLGKGKFLDARGKAQAARPPAITWIAGSPRDAKVVNIGTFLKDGKLDRTVYNCEVFNDVAAIGCDSIHMAMLAMEAARYANCQNQPPVMPSWGLSGASRDPAAVKKLWGEHAESNPNRSDKWWNF